MFFVVLYVTAVPKICDILLPLRMTSPTSEESPAPHIALGVPELELSQHYYLVSITTKITHDLDVIFQDQGLSKIEYLFKKNFICMQNHNYLNTLKLFNEHLPSVVNCNHIYCERSVKYIDILVDIL